jgi:predicted nucleotidyltransferase
MIKLFGLSEVDIKKLQQSFEEYPEIELVILYGTRARGDFRYNSDIDLCIKGDLCSGNLLKLENEIDDLLLPFKIDLLLLHQINSQELISHIKQYGKIFYHKSHKIILNEDPVDYAALKNN